MAKRDVRNVLEQACSTFHLDVAPFRMERVHVDDGQSMVAEVLAVGYVLGVQVFFDWRVTDERAMRVRLVARGRDRKHRSELIERHEFRFRRALEGAFGSARYCPHNGVLPQWEFPVPSELLTATLTAEAAAELFERVLRCLRQAGTPSELGF